VADIAFYRLAKWPLETALPRLLEKTVQSGKRAVVMAGSKERVEVLANLLWTYERGSWLPHGSAKDGNAAEQPVWLTSADENPNAATYLFLVDGAQSARLAECERCFELFDGNDPDAVTEARQHWKAYTNAGHELTYWQQTERGGWQRQEAAAKE